MVKKIQIERDFRVRFAQIDGARVIYYPRYLEMIAETFPAVALDDTPFDLAIRFMQSNRLGDDIKMRLTENADGWSVTGSLDGEHFSIVRSRRTEGDALPSYQSEHASFESGAFTIHDWMCGPSGRLHLSRYYELISHTIEQWFDSSLGITFSELHVAEDLGIPTVQMDTCCLRLPCRGESVHMGLRPTSVGASAVQLMTWLTGQGKILIETRQVIVFVELHDKKITSTRIPDALRTRLTMQLAAAGCE
jgi:4-hydroxybenzoyl-CoA thioesterase